jgi:hypothetical protein
MHLAVRHCGSKRTIIENGNKHKSKQNPFPSYSTLVKIKTSTLTHVTQKLLLNRLETNEEKLALQANNSTKEEMCLSLV